MCHYVFTRRCIGKGKCTTRTVGGAFYFRRTERAIVDLTSDCEEIANCEEVIIEEGSNENCVEVSFIKELDSANNAYTFIADFEGRDEVNYEWYVLLDDQHIGGESREAGSEDDHEFYFEFEKDVEYRVCLKQEDCYDYQVCEIIEFE